MKRLTLYIILCILLAKLSLAQDLESVGKEKPFQLGGGLSLNQIFAKSNHVIGRNPYSYVASGSLNLSLYGWNVPVSFSISNEKFTYQQPFNRYSIHPSYKSLTAHFGYTSVNFSPYTMNGHLFLGAAADVKKEKWFISTFYGRLLKETAPDTIHNNPGSFERWGYGVNGGYTSEKASVSLSFFKADDERSDFVSALLRNGVTPQSNVAVGLAWSQKILEQFVLKVDWGGTAITTNSLSAQDVVDSLKSTDILTLTTSTGFYHAIKGAFVYQGNNFSVGTGYERIDPGYKTLGAYYFNSDLESISLTATAQLLNSKLSIAANSGVQHDNLDNQKSSSLKRWVGAFNISLLPNPKLNLQAGYSNFLSFTNIRSQFLSINQTTPYSNLDTLNFTQLSQMTNFSVTYNLPASKNRIQNVTLSGNMQQASNKQGQRTLQNSGSTFYNSFATYMMSFELQQLSLSFSLNYSRVASTFSNTNIFGPVISVNKVLPNKKFRVNGSCALNKTMIERGSDTKVLTTRVSGSYQPGKGHQLLLTSSMMQKVLDVSDKTERTNDLTIMLGYNYQFQ
jgi:hypothetical protein